MLTGSLVKASITNLDTNETVECLFNPTEYTFSKSSDWAEGKRRGQNVPQLEFNGGKPTELKMQLFFDTYESGEDVRKTYTHALWKLVMVDPSTEDPKTKKGRPPKCEFRWGTTWSFKAVVVSMTQKFTLFLPDGTPVRATLDVTFKQVEDEGLYPKQNPTTGGSAGQRVRVVRESDSLAWIAFQEYGDASLWRFLADANHIANPMRLEPGQTLAIPPRP